MTIPAETDSQRTADSQLVGSWYALSLHLSAKAVADRDEIRNAVKTALIFAAKRAGSERNMRRALEGTE